MPVGHGFPLLVGYGAVVALRPVASAVEDKGFRPSPFLEPVKGAVDRRITSYNVCYTKLLRVFAGWCRYLMGVNDRGERFEPSPDARNNFV